MTLAMTYSFLVGLTYLARFAFPYEIGLSATTTHIIRLLVRKSVSLLDVFSIDQGYYLQTG